MTQISTSTTSASTPELHWTCVCALGDILPGSGVCALVGGKQIAVFRVAGRVFALSNLDPFTNANVLSRGLTGSYTVDGQERFKVASPLLKHTFDLESGVCLSDASVRVPTYRVRVEDDLPGTRVWIGDEWTGSTD